MMTHGIQRWKDSQQCEMRGSVGERRAIKGFSMKK